MTLYIATQTATLLYIESLPLCRTSMPCLLPQHQENTLVFPLYVPMWQSLFVRPIRLCLVVCICMQSMLHVPPHFVQYRFCWVLTNMTVVFLTLPGWAAQVYSGIMFQYC